MPLFVARQPILDASLKTYGYELLFRNGVDNIFNEDDHDYASLSVMDTSLHQLGMRSIASGRLAFINCTRFLLLKGYVELLPKEHVVLEILENIKLDDRLVDACYRIKSEGYSLALDDFEYAPEYDPLLAIVDYVKIDFRRTPPAERTRLEELLLPMGIRLVAECVETQEEFEAARDAGYSLFQGFFFSRPVMMKTDNAPDSRLSRLQLLKEVNRRTPDLGEAETIIKHDPMLTLKLLRYVNSAGMGLSHEIQSIRHALTMLGLRNFRKWVTVQILTGVGERKPPALIHLTVIRGRFCEMLVRQNENGRDPDEAFMVGTLSLLHILTDLPMTELVAELPLSDPVKNALLEKPSAYTGLLHLIIAFESAEWEQVSAISKSLGIDENDLPSIHREAIEWADSVVLV